ncbi:MAG: MBOAT family O-acyltransferase [Anaerovoracaceae bacterium]|nr:MBOAT family O-acyltransferase [Anaerovoracaceae bacterium]
MIFSAAFNYAMGNEILTYQQLHKNPKPTLIFTVIVNIFILSFFKYYGFATDIVNTVLGTDFHTTPLPLPIGISFYTFQALSYIFDIYNHKVTKHNRFIEFILYLSLFPQLIAGPIVQYKDVENQLRYRTVDMKEFGYGAERFIIGLSKKVLLANTLGSFHNIVIKMPESSQSTAAVWIGIICFTFQIYFDFSGYSDMAIGLGRMFGFHFKENFNYPYISKSVTEFWRRWHISLGSWFREYLYIPMGGNRVSPLRHIFNLLVVWSLTGLWHGANYNFILWGLYFGILLILEKYFLFRILDKISNKIRVCLTFVTVVISWVFFSSETATEAFSYLGKMFFLKGIPFANADAHYIFASSILIIMISAVCSTPLISQAFEMLKSKKAIFANFILLILMILSTASLIYTSYNPFLYFRF